MASALAPIAEAVFALLVADTTLVAALSGGVHGTLPAGVTFPCLWIETLWERDVRGFGTGGLPEVDVRLHTFSQHGSLSEAQSANGLAVGLLKDATLTIPGYTQAGKVVYRNTVTLPEEVLNGVRVHEVVAFFTAWCE